jgi:lipopolysaccharide biosynthesis protein/GT2 family glycosyltransferase/glycosyltransferase involved in cell wall biosynthesis
MMSNDVELIERSVLFDPDWYVTQYPDVPYSGLYPAEHYLKFGAILSRNPSPLFDGDHYLDRYPDVRAAGVNPLLHYERYGRREKRIVSGLSRDAAVVEARHGRVAVVLHAYHAEIIPECLERIANVGTCDLFVTTPHDEHGPEVSAIRARHPESKIFVRPNCGRDVGPFLSIWDRIANYDVCCKLHTKKGVTGFADIWREICFEALLGSRDGVAEILSTFDREPDLALLGPECMYKSGHRMIGANAEGIRRLEKLISVDAPPLDSPDWGFFAGSVFWFRPRGIAPIGALSGLDFGPECGAEDGTPAHAVERLFGSRVLAPTSRIGLARRRFDGRVEVNVVTSPGAPDEEVYVVTLDKYRAGKANPSALIGHLDGREEDAPTLRGWMAMRGDSRARRAALKVDDRHVAYVDCDDYRADLATHRIGQGMHAFEFEVPIGLKDGRPHQLALVDTLTGKEVHRRSVRWPVAPPDLFLLTSQEEVAETVIIATGKLSNPIDGIDDDIDRIDVEFDLICPASPRGPIVVANPNCRRLFEIPMSPLFTGAALFLHLVNSGHLCRYQNVCWIDLDGFPSDIAGVWHGSARLVGGDTGVAATIVSSQDVTAWPAERRTVISAALAGLMRARENVGRVDIGRGVMWIAPLLLWQLRACRLAPLSLIERTDGVATISCLLALFAREAEMSVTTIGAARRRLRSDRPSVVEETRPKILAFLLPQFHRIPENDRWWSPGFTEWTNVVRARPLFRHHDQPKFPADLGFYDLRLLETRAAQAALAKRFGIFGFCYHYYWFGGKKLLNEPIEAMLRSGEPDMPFCICWANENWTRSWDGQNRFVLIEQSYSPSALKALIGEFIEMMRDPRYIRHRDRPVLVVYRISQIPDWKNIAEMWRRECRDAGIGEIQLCAIRFGTELLDGQPEDFGVDSFVIFPPHESVFEDARPKVADLIPKFEGQILDYDAAAAGDLARFSNGAPWPVHRGAMLSWDNTARRDREARIFVGATPARFRAWLRGIVGQIAEKGAGDELVFLNAWNEWAEGTTLEPNQRFGLGYLEAVRSVLTEPYHRNDGPRAPERRPHQGPFADMTRYDGSRAEDPARPTVLLCAHLAGKELFGGERSFIDMLDGMGRLPIDIVVTLPGSVADPAARPPVSHPIGEAYLAEVRARSSAVWTFDYPWFRERPLDEHCVLRFMHVICEHGVSVVHANTIMLWEPLVAARRLGRVAVVHARELIDHDASLTSYIGLPPEETKRRVTANSDVLIANSRETARCYAHPRTHYVPNAVDLADLDLPERGRRPIRFGIVSSNLPKKGILDFVECAKICAAASLDAEFVVIGPDNAFVTSLKKECEPPHGPSNLFFSGYKPTPRDAIADIDVLMNLSHFAESFGRTVAEAMAARRPVVAYAWGALPELIEDRVNGFLVPHRDVASLADRVRYFCETPSEIARMGSNGRDIASRGFSREVLASYMAISYNEILQGQPIRHRSSLPTVVVPIYNAADDVERCLASLAADGELHEGRIILIDDGSTDPAIDKLLKRHSTDRRFEIVRNETNLGYTATINKAIRRVWEGDVVLLNSDTIVTSGWISGLRAAAYSRMNVGTVTAMSDNAGAFSFPVMGKSNPKPDGMSHDAYARHMIRHTAGVAPVEVPTGSGFCMYIRRDLIQDIGLFDETAFPRGYGEENDYCMRASKVGRINVVSPWAFVYHRKSASFGAERTKLVEHGMAVLFRRYPTYDVLVSEAFSSASMSALRDAASAAVRSLG